MFHYDMILTSGATASRKGENTEMRVITPRAALFGTVAAAALFTVPAAAAAQENPATSPAIPNNAQTQDQAATGSDQQIVVTARRRNELLLNVPVAVSAYSGEQLAARAR
jgi:iron complex outermembrane receptor protein